ncbi:MAG: hypothetical protein ACREP1_09235 [Rhodanobacteraceae bacterium]
MKYSTLKLGIASLLLAGAAFGAQPKVYCTAAKQNVKTCCCETKGGKSTCKLTGKAFDKCCCVTGTTSKAEGVKNG